MPIRRAHRHFYPIDWPQLSAVIRFTRAKGRCERCGRPHMKTVMHLGDGRWWDAALGTWRNGRGRALPRLVAPEAMPADHQRMTFVVLATAHLDHDTSNNAPRNLAALCQRCHMLHDRPEHQRRRRITLHLRKAVGDLFSGVYRIYLNSVPEITHFNKC